MSKAASDAMTAAKNKTGHTRAAECTNRSAQLRSAHKWFMITHEAHFCTAARSSQPLTLANFWRARRLVTTLNGHAVLQPATQVVPPAFVTAALKYAAIMLSQFPIERCVDFLAFQADAAVTTVGTGGDGAKRRVDYGLQQIDWMDARSKLPLPREMQAQAYMIQRVSAGLVVWETSLSCSPSTPLNDQFWFRHNGHAPKPGQCLYMAVANGQPRAKSCQALACAPPFEKTLKNKPGWAVKSHRPKKIPAGSPELDS